MDIPLAKPTSPCRFVRKNLYDRALFVYLQSLNPYECDYGKCSEILQAGYQLVIVQLSGVDGGDGQDGSSV